eukprot:TRINITY_DN4128_c0_g1_i1.p1 TRINITY_DN4128_c0_g1~~TRINITY_DN4128_c0_g1_i1.p1  ORF type:complete len:353 (+),score=34.25 TRINITY_DN4128_c0_g1_i1:69-1127(+)
MEPDEWDDDALRDFINFYDDPSTLDEEASANESSLLQSANEPPEQQGNDQPQDHPWLTLDTSGAPRICSPVAEDLPLRGIMFEILFAFILQLCWWPSSNLWITKHKDSWYPLDRGVLRDLNVFGVQRADKDKLGIIRSQDGPHTIAYRCRNWLLTSTTERWTKKGLDQDHSREGTCIKVYSLWRLTEHKDEEGHWIAQLYRIENRRIDWVRLRGMRSPKFNRKKACEPCFGDDTSQAIHDPLQLLNILFDPSVPETSHDLRDEEIHLPDTKPPSKRSLTRTKRASKKRRSASPTMPTVPIQSPTIQPLDQGRGSEPRVPPYQEQTFTQSLTLSHIQSQLHPDLFKMLIGHPM